MDLSQQTIQFILEGALVTFKIWFFTIVLALPLSVVVALIRNNKIRFLSPILTIYTNLIRGTPIILQLYAIYFVLPIVLNMRLSGFTASILTFVLSWVAYINEVLRISLSSIEKWQYDSAKALGFTYLQTIWYIVLPQAFWRASGAIWNEMINILYNTPVIALIGMDELLKNVKVVVVRTFDFTLFLWLGLFYLGFNYLIIVISKKVESRLNRFIVAELK